MVDNNQFNDLSRLFRLCIMVPTGLPCLKAALTESIVQRGRSINEASLGDDFVDVEEESREPESPNKKDKGKAKAKNAGSGIQPAVTWVQEVLNLKDKIDTVWKKSFQSNREVESSINNVWI